MANEKEYKQLLNVDLEECRSLFEYILDNISEGLVVLNKDMKYIVWNRATEEDSGVNRESVLGKKITDVFPEMKNSKFLLAYQRVLQSGKPEVIEEKFTLPDGKTNWYRDRIYPFRDNLIIFGQNITKEKEIQRI